MSKKALLILFSGLLYCCSVKAQKRDTLIFYVHVKNLSVTEKYQEFTANKDSADFLRFVLPPDLSVDKDLYIVNEYYKNGAKKLIGKSYGGFGFEGLDGPIVEFFINGHRKSIKTYFDGKLAGDVTQYFPNGKIYLIGNYDNNNLTINECRDSTGKVLAENGNGHCIKYDDDFKYIVAEGNIENGLEEGEWHGFTGDTAKYICTYEKGVIKKGMGYEKGKEYPFINANIDPNFKGGIENFYKYLSKNIHYPDEAKKKNVQGKVFVTFIVERDGKLSDIKISQGRGYGLDEEVMRIMKLSPPWVPGLVYGLPARVKYSVPITFSLTND